ncbi:MAG: lytic transglycosylase domain-containing protein [Victivallales bacterium]|nr:lytic transglycosylase domain-containing protein [Victivallales bacterium]
MYSYKKQKKTSNKNKIIIIALLIAFAALTFYYSSRRNENRYDAIIEKTAKKYNVDSRLIKAVISQESKFDDRARGTSGEIGLMQIMPNGAAVDWARHYKLDKLSKGVLFVPKVNIEIGTWYLSKALKRWKNYKHDKELALCQYNAGGKRANAWKPKNYDGAMLDRIKIRSTRAYVESIMYKYKKYCEK